MVLHLAHRNQPINRHYKQNQNRNQGITNNSPKDHKGSHFLNAMYGKVCETRGALTIAALVYVSICMESSQFYISNEHFFSKA